MHELIRVAEVAPDVTAQTIESTYTYLIPDGLNVEPGDAVLVPFGAQVVAGYVIETRKTRPLDLPFDPSQLRRVQSRIAGMSMPADLVETLRFISSEYLSPLGSVVAAAMPPGIRSRVVTRYSIVANRSETKMSPAQREIIEFIEENGGSVTEQKVAKAKTLAKTGIRSLIKAGLLAKEVEMAQDKSPRAAMLRLGDPDEVERFIASAKKKPAQAACLITLQSESRVAFTPGEIRALANTTDAIINKLVEAGMLIEVEEDTSSTRSAPKLTDEQLTAANEIGDSLRQSAGRRFLLFGVTGSGKTEVYLRAVSDALAMGKQALYIVPEIALTAQVVSQLRARFGSVVAVMHSALSEGERLKNWRRIQNGETPVVLGARSAIFAPLRNIGLIVVDEEHEASYKQENAPRYHLRSVAEHRALITAATLVLGSATPSVETFHRARSGQLTLLTLPTRATKEKLPKVAISDLRRPYQLKQPSILGPELKAALNEAIEHEEQAILFINRRAYATSLLCRDCGLVPMCRRCSVSLTFHRAIRRQRCHHCGFEAKAPDTCPKCGGSRIRTLGLGTEKVEETVHKEFPNVRVARLDRDVAAKKGKVEEVFADFHEGRISILVGTQMIAKGLDFPRVSLVGVIAADTGLFIPDFRSTERTFQLLTQVAGRAGRHRPGRVVIQTFQPDHPSVVFAAKQHFVDFFVQEIAERQEAGYPPFVRLVNIVASSQDRCLADDAIHKVALHLRRKKNIEVIGPADCALEQLKGRWRRHVLVKLPTQARTSEVSLPHDLIATKGVTLTVDVDPGSLM